MFKVLYKGINGGFQLSEDMNLEQAKEFKNKCLNVGYKIVYIIKILED